MTKGHVEPGSAGDRSARDAWLGAAAFALALETVLWPGQFVSVLAPDAISWVTAGGFAGLLLLGLIPAIGFCYLGLALVGSRSSRPRRWKVGAALLAVGWGIRSFATVARVAMSGTTGELPGASVVTSGLALLVVLLVWQTAAAVLVAPLFSGTPQERSGERRNRRLGWVAVGFAVVYGLSLVAEAVVGRGGWSTVVAALFLFLAPVVAAGALFGRTQAYGQGSIRLIARNEMWLATAAGVLLLSYAITEISSSPLGSFGQGSLSGPAPGMEALFAGAQGLVGLVPPLCAAVGFTLSARSSFREARAAGATGG